LRCVADAWSTGRSHRTQIRMGFRPPGYVRHFGYGLSGLIGFAAAVAVLAPRTLAVESRLAQATTADRNTIVASISYRPIERPANAAPDFTTPENADLQFYSITTFDRVSNDAAVVTPHGGQPQNTTMVIHVHGGGGNLYGTTEAQLALQLVQHGYASMAVNTRSHDDALNTDNSFDIRNDIVAVTSVARSMGYQRIVLHGQSSGTLQVLYYAATDWSPDIKGIVLTGPFANLPWKSEVILINNDPLYHKLYNEALDAVHSGHPDALLPDAMPYPIGGRTSTPVAAQHFLTYRWQYAAPSVSTDWIRRVTVPVLLVRNSQDQTILPFEPVWLYSAGTSYGALSQDIENQVLQDSSPGNGHAFPSTIPQLAELVLGWLQNRGL
jgi:alpha-beta hydrolase superfamily lysophospholipase